MDCKYLILLLLKCNGPYNQKCLQASVLFGLTCELAHSETCCCSKVCTSSPTGLCRVSSSSFSFTQSQSSSRMAISPVHFSAPASKHSLWAHDSLKESSGHYVLFSRNLFVYIAGYIAQTFWRLYECGPHLWTYQALAPWYLGSDLSKPF